MKRAHLILATALLLLGCPPHDDDAAPASAPAPITTDCFACGLWTNLGEQQALCDPPSLGLWNDLEACLRRPDGDPAGGCGSSCAGYVASLDACVVSGDPMCSPSGGSAACDSCLYSGCGQYTIPCSEDRTGCISCSKWLLGRNMDLVCPESYGPVLDLSACACQGACSGPCAPACANQWGLLDTTLADNGCLNCLAHPKKCVVRRAACAAD